MAHNGDKRKNMTDIAQAGCSRGIEFGGYLPQQSWVCPSDRQLALRAKLETGWSVKSYQLQKYGHQVVPFDPKEIEIICSVIKRAERLERIEQERIGRLVDRVENMKKNAINNGTKQCILCGTHFGMLRCTYSLCYDCKKAVCQKCGIESTSSNGQEVLWRCQICAETREMWKKSGAWFLKGLPKYILPVKKNTNPNGKVLINYKSSFAKSNWSKNSTLRADDDSSSDEDTPGPLATTSQSSPSS